MTDEQQERQDQLDLWHTLDDPKRRAEVVERIRKRKDEEARKRKEEEARRTPAPPPAVAPKIVVTPAPVKPRTPLTPPPTPKPKAAGVLVRVSTKEQSRHGYSKDDQVAWARSEASRFGLKLIEYVEESDSHSDLLDRPALNDFEQDVVDGKVGTLMLRYADRLGRGVVFSKLVEWLKAWQVRIICGDLTEAWDATDLLMAFYGLQGGSWLRTHRSRTKDGVRRAQDAGKQVGGKLLGFRWVDGRWVPETLALSLEAGDEIDLPPWQRQRILQAIKAYRAGPDPFNALLEKRRSSSQDRHLAARRRQRERNKTREAWLLNHRPIVIDRVSP